MIKLPTANARRLAAVCATTGLKCCSKRLRPPKKKHIPMTRSRFDSILPTSEVWTITISFLVRAMMATINSTAFLFGQQSSRLVGLLAVMNSPECRIQKTTDSLSGAHGNFFRGITQHGRKRTAQLVVIFSRR